MIDPPTAPSADPAFARGYGKLIPGVGFILLAAVIYLYQQNWPLYQQLLGYWMGEPFRTPFVDLEAIPASIRCWRQGIDVYSSTPCDVLGRPFNYAPLWLRLPFLPTEASWTPWLGLGLVSLFLLALGVLPQPKACIDRAFVVLGTFSCLPVFAAERGNADLVMFLLIVVAALCLEGGPVLRMVGYVVILLAGLLKVYPLAALLLLLRERLRIALALGCAILIGLAAFGWQYRDELTRMLQNIPRGGQFLNNWGAPDLRLGIGTALMPILTAMNVDRLDSARVGNLAEQVVAPLLTIVAIGCAIALATHRDLRRAMATMPEQPRLFLLVGAALICGCFFAGPNIGYRGVFLLFVLPGFLGLARISIGTGAARIFRATGHATLGVLWMVLIQRAVAHGFGGTFFPVGGSAVGYAVWILRELMWWWIVTVLLAILIRFALDSPTWREMPMLGRRTVTLASPPTFPPHPG